MSPESELDEVLDEVYDWVCAFVVSPYFERLGPAQQDVAEDILLAFAEFMYTYHGAFPEEWNEFEVEECCLETIPRKVLAESPYFYAVAPVLTLFFTFAGKARFLANGRVLARRVRNIGPQIVENARDPRFWGPAKTMALAVAESGIDATDMAEVERFVQAYSRIVARQHST